MKINSPAEDRIIVELTQQDMTELNITYEDMDYSTIETRRVIWTLLDRAGKELEREFDPSRRMVIEAVPKVRGGCILFFTILDCRKNIVSKKQFLKKQSEFLICEFENADSLFLAAQNFKAFLPETQSGLYEKDGKYRLILSCGENLHSVKKMLSEFCTTASGDPLSLSFVYEHWNELACGNALSRICGKSS